MLNKLKALVQPTDTFLDEYVNQKTKLHIKCQNGHIRSIIPSNLISRGQGSSCKECLGILANNKYTKEAINTLVFPYTLEGEYLGSMVKHTYVCPNGHTIKGKLLQQMKDNYRCKECFPRRSDIRTQDEFTSIVEQYNLKLCGAYRGAKTLVEVECCQGHRYNILPSNFTTHGTGTVCRTCTPIDTYTSKAQDELMDIISRKYTGKIVKNDRQVLDGKEIDIWIPDKNLGIEYHGMYWHSDKFKQEKAHLEKANLAEKAGIKLIQVFEHEWLTRKDIVISRILDHFGLQYTIYARQCTVKRINHPTAFLEDNHLQGAGAAGGIAYGLFFKEELVSVMTFGTPRFNLEYRYELIRFCTLTGVRVVGGASKLLKAFRNEHAGSILSYADRRYSNGKVYKAIGFEYSHTSIPNYTYYKAKHVLSRYQCQKHKLQALFPEHFKPELSESEIMRNAGYNKVYDAGNLVYVLK